MENGLCLDQAMTTQAMRFYLRVDTEGPWLDGIRDHLPWVEEGHHRHDANS